MNKTDVLSKICEYFEVSATEIIFLDDGQFSVDGINGTFRIVELPMEAQNQYEYALYFEG